ncbi:MAG: pyroglutamyl-peptidase I [Eubacteriales bacterium]|nr:pyroglutamyl-peptidase I [Eubacteriales bacterium]
MKILLTSFDPFNQETINPAREAVLKILAESKYKDKLVHLPIPTEFKQSKSLIEEHLSRERYAAILAIGQAGGRFAISPERVAINISDAGICDNAGYRPVDEPVISDAPAAYFSTLPLKEMIAAAKAAGIPAALSNSAGTFVCNALMYTILHHCAQTNPSCLAGFIHVPYLPEQVIDKAAKASMSLENISRGLDQMLEVVYKAIV